MSRGVDRAIPAQMDEPGSVVTSVLLPKARHPAAVTTGPGSTVKPESNQDTDPKIGRGKGGAELYAVYNWRWYVLATVAALNCFNTMSWISFAPVANRVDEFYGSSTANFLTMIFLIVSFPVGFFSIWSASKFGIRLAILVAGWTNCIGALIRLVSCLHFMPLAGRQPTVLIGQTIASIAYPFIMFLPTKTAAAWFPDGQRAMANTLATLSNPLGILLAMLIAPGLVRRPNDVIYLNLLTALLSTLVCLAATLGVRSSEPPTPPTSSAAQPSLPFVEGLKKLARSRSFWILLIALGSGIGMFNSLYGMMQQMLCARGYSNAFSGLCCVLMIVGGFLGAFASAIVVDKTKKFVLVIKSAFFLALVAGVIFSICVLRPGLAVPIAISCFVFGFFGIAAYPIGLEMAVECSFPVAETMSSGLIVLGGQLLGTLYIVGMQVLRTPLTGEQSLNETCSLRVDDSSYLNHTVLIIPTSTVAAPIARGVVLPYDMTWAMIAFCAVGGLIICLFVLLFKPKLRRLRMEQQLKVIVPGDDVQLIAHQAVAKLAPLSEDDANFDPVGQEEMVDLSPLKRQQHLNERGDHRVLLDK